MLVSRHAKTPEQHERIKSQMITQFLFRDLQPVTLLVPPSAFRTQAPHPPPPPVVEPLESIPAMMRVAVRCGWAGAPSVPCWPDPLNTCESTRSGVNARIPSLLLLLFTSYPHPARRRPDRLNRFRVLPDDAVQDLARRVLRRARRRVNNDSSTKATPLPCRQSLPQSSHTRHHGWAMHGLPVDVSCLPVDESCMPAPPCRPPPAVRAFETAPYSGVHAFSGR